MGRVDKNFAVLKWDSQVFGFKVARICCIDVQEHKFAAILDGLRTQGCRLAYWNTVAEDETANAVAKMHGGFLADERITYVKTLVGRSSEIGPGSITVAPVSSQDSFVTLVSLALQSGKHSRFNRDPQFPRELFERLYTHWLARSIRKEIAWEVLVAKDANSAIVGMVTLGSKEARGDIGLLAVSLGARGIGIGKCLMIAAENRFRDNGYGVVQVCTQRTNMPACRLYESRGFKIDNVENVYHFWL